MWDNKLQETGHIYRGFPGQGSKSEAEWGAGGERGKAALPVARICLWSSWSSCCLSSAPVTIRSFLPSQKNLFKPLVDFPVITNPPPLLTASLGWTSPFGVTMVGATQSWEQSLDAEGPPSCRGCVLWLRARPPHVMRRAAITPLVPGHELLHAEDSPWLPLGWTWSSWSTPAALPPLITSSCPFSAWAICCPCAGRRPPCLPLGGFSSRARTPGSSCALCPLSCLQYCCEQDRSSRRSFSWGDQIMRFRIFPARQKLRLRQKLSSRSSWTERRVQPCSQR